MRINKLNQQMTMLVMISLSSAERRPPVTQDCFKQLGKAVYSRNAVYSRRLEVDVECGRPTNHRTQLNGLLFDGCIVSSICTSYFLKQCLFGGSPGRLLANSMSICTSSCSARPFFAHKMHSFNSWATTTQFQVDSPRS